MKALSSAAVLTLLLAFSAPAFAGPGEKGPGHVQTEQTQLDTQQMDDLYEAYQAKVSPLHDQLMGKMMELRAIQNLSGTTKEDVSKLVQEITALRGKIENERRAYSQTLRKQGMPAYQGWHKGGMGGCGGMRGGCPMMGGYDGDYRSGHDGGGHGGRHGWGGHW